MARLGVDRPRSRDKIITNLYMDKALRAYGRYGVVSLHIHILFTMLFVRHKV